MPRKRPKRPRITPDLYDYLNISPRPLPETESPLVSIEVSDDWPDMPPIGLREIQLTEAHLEKVLAELFGVMP